MSLSKEAVEGAPVKERNKINWNVTTPAERHRRLASAIIVAEGFVPQNFTTLEELRDVRKSFNKLLRVVQGDFQERRGLNDMACRDVDNHFDRFPETFVFHSMLWLKKEQAVFPLSCARRDCDMDFAMLANARDGLWRMLRKRESEIKSETDLKGVRDLRRVASIEAVRAWSEPRSMGTTEISSDDEKPRGRPNSVVGIRGGALFAIDAGHEGREQRLDTLLVSAKMFMPSTCITLREINVIRNGFNRKLELVTNDLKARKVLFFGMHWKELEEHSEHVPGAKVYSEKWWEKQRAFGPLWKVQRDYGKDFARVVNAKHALHCALDKRVREIFDTFRRATEAARRPWIRAYSVPATIRFTEEKKDDGKSRARSKSVTGVRGGAQSAIDKGHEFIEASDSDEDFSATEYRDDSSGDATSEHLATTSNHHDDIDHDAGSDDYHIVSEGADFIGGPTRSHCSISSAAETVIPSYTTIVPIIEARRTFNEPPLAIGAENAASLRRHEQYLKHFWVSLEDAGKLRKVGSEGPRKRLERLNNDYWNEYAALVRRRRELIAAEVEVAAGVINGEPQVGVVQLDKSNDVSSTVVEVGRYLPPTMEDVEVEDEPVFALPMRGDLSLRTDIGYQDGIPIYTTNLQDTDAVKISLAWPEQPAASHAAKSYSTVADVDVAIVKARQVLMSRRWAIRTQSVESRSRFARNECYTTPTQNYGPARGDLILLYNHHHKQLLALHVIFLVKQSLLRRRRNELLDTEVGGTQESLRGGDLSVRTDHEHQDNPDAIKVFLSWPEEPVLGIYSVGEQYATVTDVIAALSLGRELLRKAIGKIRAQSLGFAQTMRNLIPAKQERDEWCRGYNHYHRQVRTLQIRFLTRQAVLLKRRNELLDAESDSALVSLRGGAFDDCSDISPSPTLSESSSPDVAADCGEYPTAIANVDEPMTASRQVTRQHILSLEGLNNSALQHVSDLEKEGESIRTQAVFGHWNRLVVDRDYRQQLLSLQKAHLLEPGKLLISRNCLLEAWNMGSEFESDLVDGVKRNYSNTGAIEMPRYRALLPAPMSWKVGAPVVVATRGGGLSSESGSEDEESKPTTVDELDEAIVASRRFLKGNLLLIPCKGHCFPVFHQSQSMLHLIKLRLRKQRRATRYRENRDYHKGLLVLRSTERKHHDVKCEGLSKFLGFHVDTALSQREVGKLLEDREQEICTPSEAIRPTRAQAEEQESREAMTFELPVRGGALSSPESSASDNSEDYTTIVEVEEAIVEARTLLREQLSAVESRNFASHVRHAQEERRINDERHIRNLERDEAITRIGDIRDLEKQAYEKEIDHLKLLHKEKVADLQRRLEELLADAKAKAEKPPVVSEAPEMEAAVASVADLEDPEPISFPPAEPVVKLPGQTKKAGDESSPVEGLRGGAGSLFQEVLEENEQHFLDGNLAPTHAFAEALKQVVANGIFRRTSSSASSTIRSESRENNSLKRERVALLSSSRIDNALKALRCVDVNAHVVKSDDGHTIGAFTSARHERTQRAESDGVSTDWYRPLAEFQYSDHWYEEPQPGINVGSDGAGSPVLYSSPVVSDTSTEVQAKRETFNSKESETDGWCYLSSSGTIGRVGVKDDPPVVLDYVPGCGFLPRTTKDRPWVLHKQGMRMEDPVLAALAAKMVEFRKSEPSVTEWAAGMSPNDEVDDPWSHPIADDDSIPSQPVGNIVITALSAERSMDANPTGLTTPAFLRNIQRCARYVKDTVKHDRHWLPLGEKYCRSPRLLPVDETFGLDTESENEGPAKFALKLPEPPHPRVSQVLDRKLEASLTESAKAAGRQTRTGMRRLRKGKMSFHSLRKHIRNTRHDKVPFKSHKRKYFSRKESLNTDEYDGLLEGADSGMEKEGMSSFVDKWNDYAHTHGFWHTRRDKAAQPPYELLPPALWKLHLEPPKEDEIEDDFSGGDCFSAGFVQDPYDTSDYENSNLIGISQRTEQIMRERAWRRKRGMDGRQEREMPEGEDFESYFRRVYPCVKRAKSEPKLSPKVKLEEVGEAEDYGSIKKWTERGLKDPLQGLRGGSLDEDEDTPFAPPTPAKSNGRISLLADDRLWQSFKRKGKWSSTTSFIDSGPPPHGLSDEPCPERRKLHHINRPSSPLRYQPPVPHFPPSPPRTPPRLPTSPTFLEEPVYFWSMLGILSHSKKFDLIRLNLDFVPLLTPGDFDKFCQLNSKTLGDMGRSFIAKRRQAGKLWTPEHRLLSATNRGASGCEHVEEWLETTFPEGPIKYTKARKRRDIVNVFCLKHS